jgi:hypothetical protein
MIFQTQWSDLGCSCSVWRRGSARLDGEELRHHTNPDQSKAIMLGAMSAD